MGKDQSEGGISIIANPDGTSRLNHRHPAAF